MATIITVHGTGATGPEQGERWWQKGSVFERHIRKLVASEDGELKFEPHIWDGANSETSRRAAAKPLLKKCKELNRRGERYCLIGHSHGGSVIAAALFLAVRQGLHLVQLERWITVATPFLTPRKRWFLFSRINFWGKTAFVLVLTACALVGLAAFAIPANRQFWQNITFERSHYHALSVLIFASPALIVLIILRFLAARDYFSGNRRLARRFNSVFGDKWYSLFHVNDEAMQGLRLAQQIRFPLFQKFSFVQPISLVSLTTFPIAFILLLTSEELMIRIFDYYKDTIALYGDSRILIENEHLRGNGKDITINAMLIIGCILYPLAQIGESLFGFSPEWLPITPSSLLQILYLVVVSLLLYLLSLLVVLTITGLGTIGSSGLSRVLDAITWRQLKASAFGDDYRAEGIVGSEVHPFWVSDSRAPLPDELSKEIAAFSDKKAAQSISRLRLALNALAFAEGGQQKADMLSEYLSWEELIHTSYFYLPRFRKLVAYAISQSDGFRATDQFMNDPDYGLVAKWYEEIQPQARAAGGVRA